MARLVQGMRNIVFQSMKAAPRTIVQQRCMHSIQLTGVAAPALLRNVQVNIDTRNQKKKWKHLAIVRFDRSVSQNNISTRASHNHTGQ